MTRLLHWQADLIRRWYTPERQMLVGVAMIDISLVYLAWWKWSGEPFGIFTMSVLALTFAGIVAVAEAKLAEDNDQGQDSVSSNQEDAMPAKKKAPPPVVVEPRDGGKKWAVQRDKGQRASSLSPTQAAAEKKGRQIAKNQGAELVVKGKDGRIQRKDSHGRDPRSSKG